ncbi:MAG: tyrosine-type recombinase/integrase, partial [Oscillospiraceae bacterium]|nr:tyrosine-type recombinase/integrase [Oscillospiraceae bacterium]
MNYTFQSHFAVRLEKFIVQKNALGYPYQESSRILRKFDLFCLEHYPQETELTKEICLAWAVRKKNECRNTFRNRIFPIREFARYLNCIGEEAYLIPVNLARKGTPAVPHIYTEAEIIAIWDVLEHLPVKRNFPVRHLVIPALVKLLYCCGLRPSEARKLLRKDVDLDKGRLNIIESKAHKSRIVMMADDVTVM